MARWFQYPSKVDPPFQSKTGNNDAPVSVIIATSVIFATSFMYQAVAEPIQFAKAVTVDEWFNPLSEPVRVKPGLQSKLQQNLIAPPQQPAQFITFSNEFDLVTTTSFRYQSIAEPVVVAETITVDKWHNWLSEPVRQKPGLAARYQQPFQPDVKPNVSFSWFGNLSDPVRLKVGLGSHLQQTATADTEPTVSFGWNYGWSEPVRVKPGLRAWQQRDLFWDTRLLENVTLDKWFGWLSEPVRVKAGLGAWQQQFFQPDTEPNVSFSWFAPLSEPVRLKIGLSAQQQQFFQPDTEPQVSFGWSDGLSEPVRLKLGLGAHLQRDLFWVFQPTEIITVDKWFNWLSEPVRIKAGLGAWQQQFFQPDTTPQVSFGWFEPLTEPVRLKIGLAPQQQQFFQPDTEPQVSFSWSDGLSEPVRTRWFAAAQQQALAWSAFTPETFKDTKWFTPLSEPVRLKIGLQAGLQQPSTFDTEPTVSFSWFASLTEPVRLKIGLRSDLQQFFTFDTEPTVSFGWNYGYSEPVRTKIGLRVEQQHDLFWVFNPTEIVTVDKWFIPLSEPVRLKVGLGAWQQQFFQPDTEPNVSFGWFEPLSEPVRLKLGLAATQQQVLQTDTEPNVSFGWSDGLSEPVRTRWFAAAQQSSLAWSSFTPAAVTDMRWFTPLSEPVRVKAGLPVGQQQFFAIGTQPTVSFGWSDGLSEPVRTRLFTAAQQSPLAWSSFTPAAVTDIRWFAPLSEPVRLKRGLPVGEQQFFAIRTQPTVSFGWFEPLSEPVRLKPGIHSSRQPFFTISGNPVVSIGWFEPLSEPVRVKLGLRPSAQEFLARAPISPPFPGVGDFAAVYTSVQYQKDLLYPSLQQPEHVPAITNVNISLNATETGDIFSGRLQIGVCRQANVSIVEVVVPAASNTSSVIVQSVFADVSIIEIQNYNAIVSFEAALVDDHGNALVDANGNLLVIGPLRITISASNVRTSVAIIEKC